MDCAFFRNDLPRLFAASLFLTIGFGAPGAGADLIVSGEGGLARLDGDSGELREIFSSDPGFSFVRAGPAGDIFALRGATGTLHRFDGATLNYRGIFASSEHLSGAAAFAFAGNGELVVGKETSLMFFAPDDEEPRRTIGLGAKGVEQIGGLAAGPDGRFYVSDRVGGRMYRVDLETDGDPVAALADRFGLPRGIAFDQDGALLTADAGITPALVRLAGDDRFLAGFFPGDLPEEHEFRTPIDLAVGPDGRIVAADPEAGRLVRFDPDLSFTDAPGEGSPAWRRPRSVTFTVLPAGGTDYSDWREAHFSPEDREDGSISGMEADPAGDGRVNLLRYGLGAGPLEPVADRLPSQWIETDEGEEYLFIQYTRARGRTDLDVRVEVSDDLAQWDSAPERLSLVSLENLGDTERVTRRDTVPVASMDRRFFRLFIRHRPPAN